MNTVLADNYSAEINRMARGDALRALTKRRLQELGITPIAAAKQAGLGREFIATLLDGRKATINASKIAAFAAAIQVDPTEVLAAQMEDGLSPLPEVAIRRGAGGATAPIDVAALRALLLGSYRSVGMAPESAEMLIRALLGACRTSQSGASSERDTDQLERLGALLTDAARQ